MDFSDEDRETLKAALRRLEAPGFAAKLTALAGRPVGLAMRALPAAAVGVVARATERALTQGLDIALFSLRLRRLGGGRLVHSALASASGAIGGAFGLAALAIELSVSTKIMLRAIAAIAREEGEDLGEPSTGLACLEVFALGHAGAIAEADTEGGYFALRALLASGLAQAADAVMHKGTVHGSSALALRLLSPIVSRFSAVVSEKLAAQAVAVVGAVGGATVNLAFIEHFQDLARGHFAVRRLERVYGAEAVRIEYERLRNTSAGDREQIADIRKGMC